MDRFILIDSREAYNIDELNAHADRLEYEEWLMTTDPMEAWIDSLESDVSDEEIFSAVRG